VHAVNYRRKFACLLLMKAPKRCLAEWAMCIAAAMEGKVLPNEPFWFGNVIGSGGIALAVLLAPATASAQSLSADRIGAIEQHIQRLEGELQALKRELGATRKQLRESRREVEAARARASQPASPPDQPLVQTRTEAPLAVSPTIAAESEPRLVKTSRNRFGLESADGRYSIALTGRLHFDAGDYLDYHPQSRFASVQNLNSGVNARRARLGVVGKFAEDWNYTFIYDFGGSSDGLPPTAGAPSSGIENAFITYNGLNKGPLPLAFDLGYLSTPFTLGRATSSNDILLVERASAQVIADAIMGGDSRSALGMRSNDERYWAGVYLTGPQAGTAHNTGKQLGAIGRATYQVVQQPNSSVHVGIDTGGLLKPPTVDGIRTITLSDRPELRVDPTVVLTTGALGTAANPLSNAAVYGFEAAAAYENLFIEGEYYWIAVNRDGLAGNTFGGGYVEGSWALTGEHRLYNPERGAYFSIVPARPFSPWEDEFGIGAFELAARYSTIDLNDKFVSGAVPGPANAVGGGRQTVYAVGLNWYPNSNMRFMLDYLHGTIDKRFSTAAGGGVTGAPPGTPVGGNFDAVVLRTQVAF
jgi:phosphate-selective porin OprO and OprP